MRKEFEVISRGDYHEKLTIENGKVVLIEGWCEPEIEDPRFFFNKVSTENGRTYREYEHSCVERPEEEKEAEKAIFTASVLSTLESFVKDNPQALTEIYACLDNGIEKDYCHKLIK